MFIYLLERLQNALSVCGYLHRHLIIRSIKSRMKTKQLRLRTVLNSKEEENPLLITFCYYRKSLLALLEICPGYFHIEYLSLEVFPLPFDFRV